MLTVTKMLMIKVIGALTVTKLLVYLARY